MLPERLSFHLSSLLPNEPRAAIVIETLIHDDGSIGDAVCYPALVENKAKLDYPSVSAWLDGHAPPPGALATDATLREQVQLHDRLARMLADARRRDGAIDVDTGEVRPVVDRAGHVTGLVAHHQDRAGRVIEELMIASNRGVARALDKARVPSLRRVVKQPERWPRIVAYAAERGCTLPPAPSSLALSQASSTRCGGTHADEFTDISLAIVKLMGRGEYVAHAPDEPDIGHFGLATMEYAHSTAPNRRYPDLVTQRIIKAHARGAALALSSRRAGDASRRTARRWRRWRRRSSDACRSRPRRSCSRIAWAQRLRRHHHRRQRQGDVRARASRRPPRARWCAAARGSRSGRACRCGCSTSASTKGFIDFERVIPGR